MKGILKLIWYGKNIEYWIWIIMMIMLRKLMRNVDSIREWISVVNKSKIFIKKKYEIEWLVFKIL